MLNPPVRACTCVCVCVCGCVCARACADSSVSYLHVFTYTHTHTHAHAHAHARMHARTHTPNRCMLNPPTRTRKWACWTALDMEIVGAQNHTSEHVDAGDPGDSHWLRPVEIGSIAIHASLEYWVRCMLNPPTRTRKWACWTALDMEIVGAQNHTSEHVDAGDPGDSHWLRPVEIGTMNSLIHDRLTPVPAA